jgi:UDP-N-acetylmuramoyl-tripeptide--D-alanyl-D-alanine ligase
VVETKINQHTLWQALTNTLPPLALPPAAIPRAVVDSRYIEPGDLFTAFTGQSTDGHLYLEDAVRRGASALLCEGRGLEQAAAAGAVIIDCRQGAFNPAAAWLAAPPNAMQQRSLAYIVDDSVIALQKVGGFQRAHRTQSTLKVIGVTGSVGKTSTKELAAAVLRRRFCTLHNKGNLNSEQGLPLTLLELGWEHDRAVLEMAMYGLGEIATLCTLARPQIGIITNVGPSHLSRLGTMERIAQAKAELVQALPSADEGGVAILNWDDERVVAMAELTQARIFRYGLTPAADLWADEIQSMGMEGIRFRFYHRTPGDDKVESLVVRVPLLGSHSVHTALRAAAVGLVEGLGWEEIVAGMQSMPGQLRLVVISGINGATVIDDTYNASPASTVAALNLLHDLEPTGQGRRIAVLGDMLELGSYTGEGHQIVGRRAADVVDVLVTVGDLGRAIGEEAHEVGFDPAALHIMPDFEQAIALLRQIMQPGDLVLVKGSRAVGMDSIVVAISQEDLVFGR